MANFTKKAIQDAFVRLLNDRPLSQITVKDIVADCGINRNTFYYYFEDIPKLIEDLVMRDADAIIRAYPTIEEFNDCIQAVIDAALSKKRAVLHIYHSASREIYELHLWRVLDYGIHAYLQTALCEQEIPREDLAVLEECLSSLAFGLVSRWLKDGMRDDIRGSIERLAEIRGAAIERMLAQNGES